MYNKKRRIFEIITGVLSIIAGAVTILACSFTFAYEVGLEVLATLDLIFAVGLITLGVLSLIKPKKVGDGWRSDRIVYILLIICLAFTFIFSASEYVRDIVICDAYSTAETLIIFALPGAITTLCLKKEKSMKVVETPALTTEEQEPFGDSLEGKIEQLKYLKENGLISEEEFKEAVNKLINRIVD